MLCSTCVRVFIDDCVAHVSEYVAHVSLGNKMTLRMTNVTLVGLGKDGYN